MADGFIVRKGGVAGEPIPAPTITLVSKTDISITFTLTNNSIAEQDVTFGLTTPPTTTTITLASQATSGNQTFTGLDEDTEVTIFAQATNGVIGQLSVTTDEFDPSSLSPQLWLDAADASTITASSGSVSQWNNKGSLSNFTQATSANQPTTGVTTLNSLNVIDFDSDFLTAVTANDYKFLHDGTDYVVCAVVKMGVVNDPGQGYGLMGTNGNATANVGLLMQFRGQNNTTRGEFVISRGVAGGANSTVQLEEDDLFTANSFVITTNRVRPSNATAADRWEAQRNDDTVIKTNIRTNNPSTANPTFALQIGAVGNNAVSMKGSIAEVIILSGGNATETNRETLRDYLNEKWAVYS